MAEELNLDTVTEVAGGKTTPVNKTTNPRAVQLGRYYNYVSNGWVPYTIQSGDYLGKLAAERHTTVQRICEINPLIDDARWIIAGYGLLLPPVGV